MRLLFNIDNKGSKEIKALIPYVDKDLNYTNLIPDLKTATRDVIDLVGKEVYQIIEDLYHDSLTTPLTLFKKEFLTAISYPIATNAYNLYAPTNDLVHTNNGRKMRGDDNEKVPFEHLLDRDNAQREKRYYRALDDLILFLDEVPTFETPSGTPEEIAEQTFQNDLHTAWVESAAFKKLNALFVSSVKKFDNHFPLNSRLLLYKLVPGMNDCEQHQIIARVGKEKFNALKTKQQTAEVIDEPTDLELVNLIEKACVFHALAWSMMRFNVNLYPEGILQHYTSDRATTRGQKPALNLEVKAAEMAFTEDAQKALLAIEQLLTPPPVVVAQNVSIQPEIVSNEYGLSL